MSSNQAAERKAHPGQLNPFMTSASSGDSSTQASDVDPTVLSQPLSNDSKLNCGTYTANFNYVHVRPGPTAEYRKEEDFQCINVAESYQHFSFEELRAVDYEKGRIAPQKTYPPRSVTITVPDEPLNTPPEKSFSFEELRTKDYDDSSKGSFSFDVSSDKPSVGHVKNSWAWRASPLRAIKEPRKPKARALELAPSRWAFNPAAGIAATPTSEVPPTFDFAAQPKFQDSPKKAKLSIEAKPLPSILFNRPGPRDATMTVQNPFSSYVSPEDAARTESVPASTVKPAGHVSAGFREYKPNHGILASKHAAKGDDSDQDSD